VRADPWPDLTGRAGWPGRPGWPGRVRWHWQVGSHGQKRSPVSQADDPDPVPFLSRAE